MADLTPQDIQEFEFRERYERELADSKTKETRNPLEGGAAASLIAAPWLSGAAATGSSAKLLRDYAMQQEARQNVLAQNANVAAASGAPILGEGEFASSKGFTPGATKNAVHNQQMRESNQLKKALHDNPVAGFHAPGNTRVILPTSFVPPASMMTPESTPIPGMREVPQTGLSRVTSPTYLGGKVLNTAMPYPAMFGAGFNATDAANYMQEGNVAQAALSGMGAAGSAATMVPHGKTRGFGAALGVTAPMINRAIDYLKGPRKEHFFGGAQDRSAFEHKADGGAVGDGMFVPDSPKDYFSINEGYDPLQEQFSVHGKHPKYGELYKNINPPEMTAYEPTMGESGSHKFQNFLESLGIDRKKASELASVSRFGANFVPFLGNAMGAEEGARDLRGAVHDVGEGKYLDAAIGAGSAALGIIPGAYGTAKLVKAANKKLKNFAGGGLTGLDQPDGIYRGETLGQRTKNLFGIDPNVEDRPSLIPLPSKKKDGNVDWSSWTAPEWLAGLAGAVATPGYAASGNEISPEQGANFATNFMGSALGASGAMKAPTGQGGKDLALNVWHGTPHEVVGGFDLSKVGTGEGAQMYGHGIYTAENPAVAKEYQKRLSQLHGGSIEGISPTGELVNYDQLRKEYYKPGRIIEGYGGLDKVVEYIDPSNSGMWGVKVKGVKDKLGTEFDPYHPDGRLRTHATDPDFKKLEKTLNEEGWNLNKGNLYKADIPDEQIPMMLDWDKPLSQQNPEVLGILSSHPAILEDLAAGRDLNTLTGRNAYEAVASSFDMGPKEAYKAASNHLRELGIPGIKYLDEGSRPNMPSVRAINTPGGKTQYEVNPGWNAPNKKQYFDTKEEALKHADTYGTRNFVSFQPETIKMLERNGMPIK